MKDGGNKKRDVDMKEEGCGRGERGRTRQGEWGRDTGLISEEEED
jgi:hypothetical protein